MVIFLSHPKKREDEKARIWPVIDIKKIRMI